MLVLDEAPEMRRELHGAGLQPRNEPLQLFAPWSITFTQERQSKKNEAAESQREK